MHSRFVVLLVVASGVTQRSIREYGTDKGTLRSDTGPAARFTDPALNDLVSALNNVKKESRVDPHLHQNIFPERLPGGVMTLKYPGNDPSDPDKDVILPHIPRWQQDTDDDRVQYDAETWTPPSVKLYKDHIAAKHEMTPDEAVNEIETELTGIDPEHGKDKKTQSALVAEGIMGGVDKNAREVANKLSRGSYGGMGVDDDTFSDDDDSTKQYIQRQMTNPVVFGIFASFFMFWCLFLKASSCENMPLLILMTMIFAMIANFFYSYLGLAAVVIVALTALCSSCCMKACSPCQKKGLQVKNGHELLEVTDEESSHFTALDSMKKLLTTGLINGSVRRADLSRGEIIQPVISRYIAKNEPSQGVRHAMTIVL